jgi:hypothetical protein
VVGKVIGVGVWPRVGLPGAGVVLGNGGAITVGGRLIVDVEVVDTTVREGLVVVYRVEMTGGGIVVDWMDVVNEGVVIGWMDVVGKVVVAGGVVCVPERITVEVNKVVVVDDSTERDGEAEAVTVVEVVGFEREELVTEFKLA